MPQPLATIQNEPQGVQGTIKVNRSSICELAELVASLAYHHAEFEVIDCGNYWLIYVSRPTE